MDIETADTEEIFFSKVSLRIEFCPPLNYLAANEASVSLSLRALSHQEPLSRVTQRGPDSRVDLRLIDGDRSERHVV